MPSDWLIGQTVDSDWLFQVEAKQLLKAFIPLDSSGTKLDRCRRWQLLVVYFLSVLLDVDWLWHHFLSNSFRYVEPQWQLLAENSSINASQLKTEECSDGWTFDKSEFRSTTVSEVTTPAFVVSPAFSPPTTTTTIPRSSACVPPNPNCLCPPLTDGRIHIPKDSDSFVLRKKLFKCVSLDSLDDNSGACCGSVGVCWGCLKGSSRLSLSVCQWELVCSLRPLKQMIQTIYMGGVLTGAIIFGGLSDRWSSPFQTANPWSTVKCVTAGCSPH